MATAKKKVAGKTNIKVDPSKLAVDYSGGGSKYRWIDGYAVAAKAIADDKEFVEFLGEAGIIEAKVKTEVKVVEKVVEPDLADPNIIAPDESSMIEESLMILEHRLHDDTKRDYAENNGANWRENHARAQTFLNLRKKLKLPDHVFATTCCVPAVEELDLQALATTAHGLDAREPATKN